MRRKRTSRKKMRRRKRNRFPHRHLFWRDKGVHGIDRHHCLLFWSFISRKRTATLVPKVDVFTSISNETKSFSIIVFFIKPLIKVVFKKLSDGKRFHFTPKCCKVLCSKCDEIFDNEYAARHITKHHPALITAGNAPSVKLVKESSQPSVSSFFKKFNKGCTGCPQMFKIVCLR